MSKKVYLSPLTDSYLLVRPRPLNGRGLFLSVRSKGNSASSPLTKAPGLLTKTPS